MFERFTDSARGTIVTAQEVARVMQCNYIGSEHLLLAMSDQEHRDPSAGPTTAARVLQSFTTTDQLHEAWDILKGEFAEGPYGSTQSGHIPFTADAKKMMELSLRRALSMGHNYIGTEHLLLAMTDLISDACAVQILDLLSIDIEALRAEVIATIDDPKHKLPKSIEIEVAKTDEGKYVVVIHGFDDEKQALNASHRIQRTSFPHYGPVEPQEVGD